MTLAEALSSTVARLRAGGIPDPERDARRLVAHAAGLETSRLTVEATRQLDDPARLEDALAQRLKRQPVSQIVGFREFYGRRFMVTPDVLDPRPETETVIECALEEPFASVLDLGTGSGCILLSLMAERRTCRGTGIDASEAALAVARRNAALHGLRPELRAGHWFRGLCGEWDLIVSNPPYIAEGEIAGLAPELGWEPRQALGAGRDGLDAFREIAAAAAHHLAPGGRIVLEIGPTQADPVRQLLARSGFTHVSVRADLDARDRAVVARAGPESGSLRLPSDRQHA